MRPRKRTFPPNPKKRGGINWAPDSSLVISSKTTLAANDGWAKFSGVNRIEETTTSGQNLVPLSQLKRYTHLFYLFGASKKEIAISGNLIGKEKMVERDRVKTNPFKHLHDDITWRTKDSSDSRSSSLRKSNRLPKITIDELELYEPKKINTVNEMIIECEETEEKEDEIKSKGSRNRTRMGDIMHKLHNSDEVKPRSFKSLYAIRTERSRSLSRGKDIILENKEEYSSEDREN